MTAIEVRKRWVDFYDPKQHERLHFELEDDDGTTRVFAGGVEITKSQCEKLSSWLRNAAKQLGS